MLFLDNISIKMKIIEFSSKTIEYSEFSNFYESPFTLKGLEWPSVEHYFQAQKFPGDPKFQEVIRNALTPSAAKKLGKTKSSHFRRDWESAKEMVMLDALQAKFEQDDYLTSLLKSTGNATLKEKSSSNSYWGIGENGKGKNRMGQLLMIVRQSL